MKKVILFLVVSLLVVTGCVMEDNIFPSTPKGKPKVMFIELNDALPEDYLNGALNVINNNFGADIDIYYGGIHDIPKNCYNGKRYRADSILNFLSEYKPDSIDRIIAITPEDISVTRTLIENGKEKTYPDRGIFGLGKISGGVCVVSKYRPYDLDTFNKTVLHEFLHTLGVHHCKHKYCIMQDGNGSGKNMKNSKKVHKECMNKAMDGFAKIN